MSPSPLEAALSRDRQIVLAALFILTVLAWGYVIWLAGHMTMSPAAQTMSPMHGMDMGVALAPAIKPWTVTDFLFTAVMWMVMMVGMMLPSAAPMILLYARVGRQAAMQDKPFAATSWFSGGYFLAWMAFSLVATLMQSGLSSAALLTPMLKTANGLLGGGILIVAGAYQWSTWKESCLAHCRSPLAFIQEHGGFKAQAMASLTLGFRHGLYCVGCCWALMLLLFAGGIMNITWIAGLAILVLIEKLMKNGRLFTRAAGLASIAGGLFLIYRYLSYMA
jgi:predicted metal-binding membrane protein